MLTEQQKLVLRLENTERALVGLHALLEDFLPVSCQEATDKMILDYFNTNVGLGADFTMVQGKAFKTE